MIRRQISFDCAGSTLFATLDEAPGTTGLLLVSGGNEIRSGSWSGQASLAARVAAAGFPVFRYDRRGVGESEGANTGFRGSGPDIAAALAAFRAKVPGLVRVVAFGNCDAAAALMLHASDLALDGLVLANPWTIDGDEAPADALPAAAIRNRYLEKLKNPREVWRLLTGGVDLRGLLGGLRAAAAAPPPPAPMVMRMRSGLDAFGKPATILLATRDRTAQLFAEVWPQDDPRIRRIDSGSHSFVGDAEQAFLTEAILAALRGQSMMGLQ